MVKEDQFFQPVKTVLIPKEANASDSFPPFLLMKGTSSEGRFAFLVWHGSEPQKKTDAGKANAEEARQPKTRQ